MKRYSNKIICIVLMCFLSYLPDVVWADEMKSYYEISKPLVLHILPAHDRYGHYDSAEIFIDADNHMIVLCSFILRDNNGYKKKISLFVFDNKVWVNNTLVLPGLPVWHGMVNNGAFQAYTTSNPPAKERVQVQTISIYTLTSDMRLSSHPAQTIKMDDSKKVFKQERYRIKKLLPLEGAPNNFFIVGYYSESRLNPIDLIGRVMSAGHWGFVVRPFGAIVKEGNITGYYNTPEKLKTNENSGISHSVVSGDTIHCVGVKRREYHSDPVVMQYLNFDLSNNHWTRPVELFRGYKNSGKMFDDFSPPALVCDKENVYCTWSWTVVDASKNDRPIRIRESGIYFCSKMNNQWDKPAKLADLGVQPQVLVDNGGTVYVFWIERSKGLLYKHKTDTEWSDAPFVIKDKRIRVKETGLPGSPTPPFSIAVDTDNNLHIIYIRDSSGSIFKGEKFTPEQLVYLKLTYAQK